MTSLPMTSLIEEATNGVRERARTAMAIPLGFASPLWFAFGAAASVGAAWWWMTRWTKAVNLEAMAPAMPAPPILAPVLAIESPPAPEIAPEALPASVLEAAQAATITAPLPSPEPAPAPVKRAAAPEPVPAPEPDDLTRLVGIGPKLADALAARGVTCFSHLAAWTADDLATIDAALSLKGRAVRDAWVAQARRFAVQAN